MRVLNIVGLAVGAMVWGYAVGHPGADYALAAVGGGLLGWCGGMLAALRS